MNFEELKLAPAILKAVLEQGYETPTPIQAQAIPAVLEGHDLLAGAQTGWLVMGRTNRVPDRARRSSSGVRSMGCPLQPSVSHRCWSAKITRMFGLLPVIAHL